MRRDSDRTFATTAILLANTALLIWTILTRNWIATVVAVVGCGYGIAGLKSCWKIRRLRRELIAAVQELNELRQRRQD